MDDAYVEADKVGVSTDVPGIVAEVGVTENQHVQAGQILYRLDDLQLRLALARAEAQIGTVRNSLNALKANYRDMQSQIQQAQNDIEYFDTEIHRQQDLLAAHVASQVTFDTARRNLRNAQQKLASLTQQLGAIAANLDDDPTGAVENKPRYLDAVASVMKPRGNSRTPLSRRLSPHRDKRSFDCTRQISPGIINGLLSRRRGSCVGCRQSQRDRVDPMFGRDNQPW